MDIAGRWVVTAASPLGELRFDVEIEERGGTIRAVASLRGQPVVVDGVRVVPEGAGYRARWTQVLTVPIRIRVAIDAVVVGDRLTGTAKPGLLPRTPLRGHRLP